MVRRRTAVMAVAAGRIVDEAGSVAATTATGAEEIVSGKLWTTTRWRGVSA